MPRRNRREKPKNFPLRFKNEPKLKVNAKEQELLDKIKRATDGDEEDQ